MKQEICTTLGSVNRMKHLLTILILVTAMSCNNVQTVKLPIKIFATSSELKASILFAKAMQATNYSSINRENLRIFQTNAIANIANLTNTSDREKLYLLLALYPVQPHVGDKIEPILDEMFLKNPIQFIFYKTNRTTISEYKIWKMRHSFFEYSYLPDDLNREEASQLISRIENDAQLYSNKSEVKTITRALTQLKDNFNSRYK